MEVGVERVRSTPNLDLDLLGDRQRVVYLNTEVSDRAFDLGVAEQQLNSPQVACLSIDQRRLC